ncbi:hypothetical protein GDO78_015702 [Eleutherodactylus coqui]|uniref:SGNH hydrolase-type esterase domain-containing protein n=1 Tax=Eleutherodactylus coqui TaxID=57060 RepID=A0A8J6ELK8_ELECQ|nr:hypothetical protein GDO78_015702 [Eleutherodactylus coqui]
MGLVIKPLMDLSQSAVAAAGTWNCHARKTIWIVGNSFVHWAQVRAARQPYGTQLGLPQNRCQVFWFGEKDLWWSGILQLMAKAAEQTLPPDILVIHAGGNDLTSLRLSRLIQRIQADIHSWMAKWPWLKVVWSKIIQRKVWLTTGRIQQVEQKRRKVNTIITNFLKSKGGSFVDHDNINFKCSNLYRPDGEHLSDIGLDLFNKSLQQMLMNCLEGVQTVD